MKVTLITHTPEPEKLIAGAANLCYSPKEISNILENLTEGNIQRLVGMLADMGHESAFEHISFTFGIEGVSRSLTHQLVRHRIGSSYSQKSQRYVMEGQFEYVIPPAINNIPEAKKIYVEAMQLDQNAYDHLVWLLLEEYCKEEIIKEGWIMLEEDTWTQALYKCDKSKHNELEKEAIEDARYVLPNACETKIVVTMNARALFNFFSKRCCNRAQWEIRNLADEMLRLVKEVAPTVFRSTGAPCTHGKCPEGSMSCGSPRIL